MIQEIMDILTPFLPVLSQVGAGAADEVGRELPEHIARAVPIFRRRHMEHIDAAGLRSALQSDATLRDQLASALGIQVHHVQTNFYGAVTVNDSAELVVGIKNERSTE